MTAPTSSTPSGTPKVPATTSTEASESTKSALASPDGRISVADGVVAKVAGLAAREMSGVHAMGTGGARALGNVRQRLPGSSGPSATQGVSVEVGETQAAIDVDLVVDYGVSIADLGRAIQRNVKSSVERMTGLQVTEVNITVDDVFVPEDSEDE
ncbi:MAG TPA: Asp23/Gls24 family envelope stress response protein [Frankiaceae bacterium]|nr:Asp23/Gls24 family envelope stress response protein [Frankiaceae bacterium]